MVEDCDDGGPELSAYGLCLVAVAIHKVSNY